MNMWKGHYQNFTETLQKRCYMIRLWNRATRLSGWQWAQNCAKFCAHCQPLNKTNSSISKPMYDADCDALFGRADGISRNCIWWYATLARKMGVKPPSMHIVYCWWSLATFPITCMQTTSNALRPRASALSRAEWWTVLYMIHIWRPHWGGRGG